MVCGVCSVRLQHVTDARVYNCMLHVAFPFRLRLYDPFLPSVNTLGCPSLLPLWGSDCLRVEAGIGERPGSVKGQHTTEGRLLRNRASLRYRNTITIYYLIVPSGSRYWRINLIDYQTPFPT